MLEAMAAGCAVVAADEGGIPDIVRDGVTGHLFKHGDLETAIAAVAESSSPMTRTVKPCVAKPVSMQKSGAGQQPRGNLEGLYRDVFVREHALQQRIAEYSRNQASEKQICGALDISKATLRRQMRLRATRQLSGQNA